MRTGPALAPRGPRHAEPAPAGNHRNHAGEGFSIIYRSRSSIILQAISHRQPQKSAAGAGARLLVHARPALDPTAAVRSGTSSPALSPLPPQAGVASGPQITGLLSTGGMATLAPVMRACLSLIALAAGAELHLPELRRLRRQASRGVRMPSSGLRLMLLGVACACIRSRGGCVMHAGVWPEPGCPAGFPAGGLPHRRHLLLLMGAGVCLVSAPQHATTCSAPAHRLSAACARPPPPAAAE